MSTAAGESGREGCGSARGLVSVSTICIRVLLVSTLLGTIAAAAQRVVIGCGVCPEVVVVPGGTFWMGSEDGSEDERPVREVEVPAFAVGVWEVTREEFRAYVDSTGLPSIVLECGFQEERGHAAACVSWEEAAEYVAWLSEVTGRHYRLLSEAEWEYVARGASRFGVYDMRRGNVREWVADCWHESYDGAPTDGGAWVAAPDGSQCGRRVLRGGSWLEEDGRYRVTNRGFRVARLRDVSVGFRVARVLR